jgi:hypothetical protein
VRVGRWDCDSDAVTVTAGKIGVRSSSFTVLHARSRYGRLGSGSADHLEADETRAAFSGVRCGRGRSQPLRGDELVDARRRALACAGTDLLPEPGGDPVRTRRPLRRHHGCDASRYTRHRSGEVRTKLGRAAPRAVRLTAQPWVIAASACTMMSKCHPVPTLISRFHRQQHLDCARNPRRQDRPRLADPLLLPACAIA